MQSATRASTKDIWPTVPSHSRMDVFGYEDAINSKDRPRGLGLLGMKERVELMNGTLNIRSGPGVGGTEITIEVPLNYEGSSG